MAPESVLRSRRDISWQLLDPSPRDGLRRWSAFDPIARASYRCGEIEAWLFEQFDGRSSLSRIHAACARQMPHHRLSFPELEGLARMLLARGLVQCVNLGKEASPEPVKAASGAWLRTVNSVVSWRLRGVDPDRWLRWLAPHTGWVFSALAVRVWTGLAALISLLVLADFARLAEQATLWQWLMQPASGSSLFLVFVVTRAVHELGHALVLTRYGGRCPDIGLIFMLGAPCVYCDVTESWRLPSAWQRAAVAAGGMFAELIVATIAAMIWLATIEGWVNTLALQTMVVCSVSTLLINVNPLMRFDGYYILSDCLDEPNLRAKADQCSLAIAYRWVLGGAGSGLAAERPRAARFWMLAAFSLAGLIYRLSLSLMMATVVVALYSAWHLVWVGRFIAIILLVSWWVMPAMKFAQNLLRSATGWWGRLRLAALAAWILLMLCVVPLPCRETASGWVQPERMQGLYAPVTARLERVFKNSGQRVAPGQIVFELAAEQPRLRAIEMSHVAMKARARLVSLERQRYYTQDIDLTALQTTAQTARQQAEHALEAVQRQSVRCTFAGRLMSLPAPKMLDIDNRPIGHTPWLWLDGSQVGRYVPAGTMLGAICSEQQFAVLPLADAQLMAVSEGTAVRLYIPALGQHVWTSTVSAIVRLEQIDSVARLIAHGSAPEHTSSATAEPGPGSSPDSAGYAAIVKLPITGAHVNAEVRAVFTVAPKTCAWRIQQWTRTNARWLTQ